MKKIIGLSVFLLAGSVNAATLLDENFDPINASDWTISNGGVRGAGNSEFFDGNALHFNGSGSRNANTIGFDLSSGGDVSFRLKIGGPNDTRFFEDADNREDILFNYSIDNGSSWVNLFTFDTENPLYRDTWGLANFVLTSAASTANTMFQWEQARHSGRRYDHWAIDDVVINNNILSGGNTSAVPEPSVIAFLGLSLLGLAGMQHQKKSLIVKQITA
ncbi:MAG: hypothetical protein methR_PLP0020 (plasmid) [Methyloprofundus sp.]|nr:MAG: hypothetical protein methR_PLP0020 [Methyloprofundus sp.]